MKFSLNPLNWIPGYKTHIMGASMFLSGLGEVLSKPDLIVFPDVLATQPVQTMLTGLGLMTIRKAIANGGPARLG